MNEIFKYFHSKFLYLGVLLLLFGTNIFTAWYFLQQENKVEECICEECPSMSIEPIESTKFKVDIKGYVKKPGVYEVTEGMILNDLIKLAGGLKSNGTTDNLNLSKKLNSEDVVVVSSKSEIKKQNSVSTSSTTFSTNSSSRYSITSTTPPKDATTETNQNKKISINTATKDELMTLSGIGEAKALSIIAYREKTPFKDISEIMNVSGIGESVYEKIKDYITI